MVVFLFVEVAPSLKDQVFHLDDPGKQDKYVGQYDKTWRVRGKCLWILFGRG